MKKITVLLLVSILSLTGGFSVCAESGEEPMENEFGFTEDEAEMPEILLISQAVNHGSTHVS